mmetsp:Transcript_30537/g.99729  ORF Transcript_30537/g.99729 Transcript_30537/m.99729 type:complete len:236 (-) Transcript_30537:2055-2762(-)
MKTLHMRVLGGALRQRRPHTRRHLHLHRPMPVRPNVAAAHARRARRASALVLQASQRGAPRPARADAVHGPPRDPLPPHRRRWRPCRTHGHHGPLGRACDHILHHSFPEALRVPFGGHRGQALSILASHPDLEPALNALAPRPLLQHVDDAHVVQHGPLHDLRPHPPVVVPELVRRRGQSGGARRGVGGRGRGRGRGDGGARGGSARARGHPQLLDLRLALAALRAQERRCERAR